MSYSRSKPIVTALVLAVASALAFPFTATATATPSRAPVLLNLPAPTGPHLIGTVDLHLIDRGRVDPFVPDHRTRELMVSLWYPALTVRGFPIAPWLSARAVPHFEQSQGLPPGAVRLPDTHGHVGAPVEPGVARSVLLYSPGFGGDRGSATAQVEDLVSHGYIVVTIDHTHDASEVEFPDGRVETATIADADDALLAQDVAVRAADAGFVLDEITALNSGTNPDAERRPLPRGLSGAFDLARVGVFGHSLGGATAAATIHNDPRVRAAINMDGTLFGSAAVAGSDRPVLLVSSDHPTIPEDPTWDQFFANQCGPVLELRLTGSAHGSFNDGQVLFPQAAAVLGLGPDDLAQLVGTLDPLRSITIQRRYLRAFFDLRLRNRDGALLRQPSPRFPEVQFVRSHPSVAGECG